LGENKRRKVLGKRRKDREGVNELERKDDIEIPHRRVRLEEGILHSDHTATDFTGSMTHELRTPLNVIIGLCQLLERDRKSPLSPMQRDAVDRMERNARTLLQSVNHLLGCLRSGTFE
jgi:two-component system sensor histidine kinase BarA